jgi:C1A family cysteine protease
MISSIFTEGAMKRTLASITAVLLVFVAVLLWGGLAGGQSGGGDQAPTLSVAPMNPAFLKYQEDRDLGLLQTPAPGGHQMGYIPPVMNMSPVHQNPVDISKGKGGTPPPAYFDWRTQKKVTAIRDQGYCGTCWAFSTLGALEAFLKKNLKPAPYLSVNNMASCRWPWLVANPNGTCPEDGRCSGGNGFTSSSNLVGVYWHLLKDGVTWAPPQPRGALAGGSDPYKDCKSNYDPKCDKRPAPKVMVDSFRFISNDPTTLKNAIMNYGPVTTSIFMNNNISSNTPGNGWDPTTHVYNYFTGSTPNHMVVLVGWDDSLAGGCWIVRNSWGKKFGDKGYFYVRYGAGHINSDYNDILAFAQTRPYNKYEVLYLEDVPGMMNSVGYGNASPIYGGLVFSPWYDTEYLTAVEFYTGSPYTWYRVKVYPTVTYPAATPAYSKAQFSGTPLFDSGAIQAGEMGYYTVYLPNALTLTAGHDYGIEVGFQNFISGLGWPMPVAYQDSSWWGVDDFFGDASATTYYSGTAAPGGTFSWLASYGDPGYSAVCIRARTQW